MSAPSTEAILRRLFWKLFFRGRTLSRRRGSEGKLDNHGMWGALAFYVIIGLCLCSPAMVVNTTAYAVLLHGVTLFMVVFQMVMTAGTVLFNKEEAEILLHRPVLPRELLRAKVTVLCGFSAMLAVALNLPGMIAGAWLKDGNGWFPLAHLFSMLLMVVFSAGALVVVYQACLRWFGRERLDGMMTTMQTLLAVVLVLGSQSFRFLAYVKMDRLTHAWWLLALPPMWFASLDSVLSARNASPWLLAPAVTGVVATVFLGWLGFHHLAATYGEGLMMLNEAGPAETERKQRSRWLRHVLKIPPLCWWLRDPVERNSFLLASAYFFRDREIKLRLYPAMAQVLALPFVLLFTGHSGWEVAFAGTYMGWLPLMAMQVMEYSEHWRAAEVFQFTPYGRWQSLFHGARKAALILLALPALAVLAVAVFLFKRVDSQFLLLLPSLIVIPVWSLVPGIFHPWLPLSKPFDAKTQGRRGYVMLSIMFVVMSVSGLLSFAAWFCMRQGWFAWFLLGEALVAAIVFAGMRAIIARSNEWEPT